MNDYKYLPQHNRPSVLEISNPIKKQVNNNCLYLLLLLLHTLLCKRSNVFCGIWGNPEMLIF